MNKKQSHFRNEPRVASVLTRSNTVECLFILNTAVSSVCYICLCELHTECNHMLFFIYYIYICCNYVQNRISMTKIVLKTSRIFYFLFIFNNICYFLSKFHIILSLPIINKYVLNKSKMSFYNQFIINI